MPILPDFSPGRFRGGVFEMPIRVYYADTDAGGIVYHGTYLEMGERCRSELLRALDLPLVGQEGTGFVVRRAEIDWITPARLDDLLICATEVTHLGGASLGIRHRFLREGEESARIELVLVHIAESGRPTRIPSEMRTAFARLQQAE